jgi:hypothetical protein
MTSMELAMEITNANTITNPIDAFLGHGHVDRGGGGGNDGQQGDRIKSMAMALAMGWRASP